MAEKKKNRPQNAKPDKAIDFKAELERVSARLVRVESYGAEQVKTIEGLQAQLSQTEAAVKPLIVALYEACNRTPSTFDFRTNRGVDMVELGEVEGSPQAANVAAAMATADRYFSKKASKKK